jgi:hypothetical protein
MKFSWVELRRDLELAAHAIRARWIEVLPALCAAALAWVLGEAMGYRGKSPGFIALIGVVALVLGEAYAMRVFGPEVDRPVGEPRRSGIYLMWAALCTIWPLLLYVPAAFVMDLTVANAVPALRPGTAAGGTLIWVLFAPACLLLTIQGWAFSYVAVDGAAALDAMSNVLRALNRATFLRAVVITGVIVVVGMPFSYGLHPLAERYGALAASAASALASVVQYIIAYAVLLTTRPDVPAIRAVPYEAAGAQS